MKAVIVFSLQYILYFLEKALGVSMESLIEKEMQNKAAEPKRQSFEIFKSAVLSDMAMNTNKYRKECMENAIPEFLNFNIVESDVRNVF